ncbi:MAG: hypothetical protein R3C60_14450 [Parvularculaceae bacterium]
MSCIAKILLFLAAMTSASSVGAQQFEPSPKQPPNKELTPTAPISRGASAASAQHAPPIQTSTSLASPASNAGTAWITPFVSLPRSKDIERGIPDIAHETHAAIYVINPDTRSSAQIQIFCYDREGHLAGRLPFDEDKTNAYTIPPLQVLVRHLWQTSVWTYQAARARENKEAWRKDAVDGVWCYISASQPVLAHGVYSEQNNSGKFADYPFDFFKVSANK